MKFYPTRSLLMLFAVSLFLATPAMAQIKKGFKYLEKEDWDEALQAFAKDTSDTEVQAVAWFGMAKTLVNNKNPNKDFVKAMEYQASAADAWNAVPKEKKKEFTNDYQVSGAGIDRLRVTATTSAWRALERKKDLNLQDLGEYSRTFPYPPEEIAAAVSQKKQDMLGDAVRNAKTYEQLSYLLNNFREEIQAAFPSALKPLDQRVFDLFMQEKGVDWLGKFYSENRKHPVNYDKGKDMFPETWNSEDLTGYLDFLFQYPQSWFTPLIQKKATDFMKETPPTETQISAYSPQQKGALEELKMAAAGELIDPNDAFDESKHVKWLNYMRKLAPSDRAYMAYEKMYNYYMKKRNWPKTSEVLHTARTVFPKKEAMLKDLIAIIDEKDYGITPVNLGKTVNAEGSEYVPVPSTDGKTLYFCATGRKENLSGEDVFVSYKRDSGWTKPEVIKELSGFSNQAPVSLSADGQQLIMFSSGKPVISQKTATGWTPPKPLDIDLSKFGWVGLVQIAANNKIMVFEAREGSGFFGGGDINIYIAERVEGKWEAPIKLDSTINTEEDDRSPFLHPDMRTMYYSTNGKPGLGGMDVFKTTRIGDSWTHWTKPVNIGKELNTMTDDWAYKISTDGTTAWFSNRTTDYDQDIYYTTLPENMRPEVMKSVSIDTRGKDGKPFKGKVVVTDPATNTIIAEYDTNPTDGKTSIPIPNDKPYTVSLQQDNVFPTSVTVPVDKPGEKASNVVLKPMTVEEMVETGQTAELNLLFDYDKSELRSESAGELKKIADLARKNAYKVNLIGYSDNAGNPEYNMVLSQRRADATRKALIDLGIPAERITAKGMGEVNPVAENTTDAGRAKNRRVEVQYTK